MFLTVFSVLLLQAQSPTAAILNAVELKIPLLPSAWGIKKYVASSNNNVMEIKAVIL
jgi:hypothetical protein